MIWTEVKKWSKHTSAQVAAGFVAASAIWGFFLERTIALKNERIELLQQEAADAGRVEGLPDRVDQLEKRVGFLQSVLQVDPIDGRFAVGSAMNGPTEMTLLLANAEVRAKAKDFDGAMDLVRKVEEIYPNSAGAAVVRWEVDTGKGYEQLAVSDAIKAVKLAPTDRRVLNLELFLANYFLDRHEKDQAEEYARLALRAAPDDKVMMDSFRRSFGFLPEVPSPSPTLTWPSPTPASTPKA